MTKAQCDILFAAALITARDLPRGDPNRRRLADAMWALRAITPRAT
jgi:hypothetical protein